jgi:hypothetical protein
MTTTMTLKAAREICGTIGFPSKMPGTSYGIPAQACITGSILATIEGTVCFNCYALRGNYLYPSVAKAQQTRLNGIDNPLWEEAIITLLNHEHDKGELPPYHRWHDSGDIQSIEHLLKICRIAAAMPHILFWLPTKEGTIIARFNSAGYIVPDNLVVRLSGSKINGTAPKAWSHTSTVFNHKTGHAIGHECPARHQGNKCGDCRACWDKSIPNISYPEH